MKTIGPLLAALWLVQLFALSTGSTAESDVFRECELCPAMATIPAGQFTMGTERSSTLEWPPKRIVFEKAFAISLFPVTVSQWTRCVAEHICPRAASSGDNLPATQVSWRDVQIFLRWLHRRTGFEYRLPSEAEFEYGARAGASTTYWWGNEVGKDHANCDGCGTRFRGPSPVGAFPPNPYGLYDVLGNVWQWTDDCWSATLHKIPENGKAALDGDCAVRVIRGGSWFSPPSNIRLATRINLYKEFRGPTVGFRLARSLPQ